MGEYPGVNDNWMPIISSQGSSLLSVDLSGSDVTDYGLIYLQDCKNLQTLNLNHCDQISDHGLEYISGNLSVSSFRVAILKGWQSMHQPFLITPKYLFPKCWSLGIFLMYLYSSEIKFLKYFWLLHIWLQNIFLSQCIYY